MRKAQGYGNRWQQNVTTGTGPNPSYTFDANNRISGSGVVYDAAGNITNDGLGHTYTYDAEHRLLTVAGPSSASYVYDASGRRVQETIGAASGDYIFDQAGRVITQICLPLRLPKSYFRHNRHDCHVYHSCTDDSVVIAYYRHADWLGSSRFASTPGRAKYFDVAYAPYGEDYADSGTTDLDFTGQNQDTVSGLYDFLYREYHPNSGRWIQPDPAGLAAADPANPQSWNRDAYVGNNPLNAVDPLGLWRSDAFSSGLDGSCSINGFVSACAMVMSFASAGGGGEFGFLCNGCSSSGINTDSRGNPHSFTITATFAGMGYDYFGLDYGTAAFELGLPTDIVPSGGGGTAQVGAVLQRLSELLANDPKCLAFLNGAGTNAQQRLADILNNNLYGVTTIQPTVNANGSLTMNNGDFALVSNQIITINTLGAFFNSTYNGLSLTTNRGRIAGGTLKAQIFITLHELAHSVGVLRPDADSQRAIDANDKQIGKNCKGTIKSAGR